MKKSNGVRSFLSEYWPLMVVGLLGSIPDAMKLVRSALLMFHPPEPEPRPPIARYAVVGLLLLAVLCFVVVLFVRLSLRVLP